MMLRRALPPIAALFSLVHTIQLFLQPYKERYQDARDALKGWWRVRAERLSLTACLMRLVSLYHMLQGSWTSLICSQWYSGGLPPGTGILSGMIPRGSGSGRFGMSRSTSSGWQWCMPCGVRKHPSVMRPPMKDQLSLPLDKRS